MATQSQIQKEINIRVDKLKAKKQLIKKIISMNNWYLKVDADTVISIMLDLGYSKEEAIANYKVLLQGEK